MVLLLFYDSHAAHIRLKHLGNVYGPVGIQIVFQERDQHTGRGGYGVV